MVDKIAHISAFGKEYPIVMNLNVMEDLQDEYGSLDAWAKLTGANSDVPDIKALKTGFYFMINEGIDMENDIKGENNPLVTMKQVGRIISECGVAHVLNAIRSTTVAATDTGEVEKNA